MSNRIEDNITKEKYEQRGGGVEIDLTEWGYEGHFMSAYQNYLGGGILGSVANDSTIKDWINVDELAQLASDLKDYYIQNSYHDEYNEDFENRPVNYPGLA